MLAQWSASSFGRIKLLSDHSGTVLVGTELTTHGTQSLTLDHLSHLRHSLEKIKVVAKNSKQKLTRLLLVSSTVCCDDDDGMTCRFCDADDDGVIFSLHSRQFRTAQVQTSLKH